MDNKIFCCPECLPKLKRFKKVKDLNIHLTTKHSANYKITLAGDAAIPILAIKTNKLIAQSGYIHSVYSKK